MSEFVNKHSRDGAHVFCRLSKSALATNPRCGPTPPSPTRDQNLNINQPYSSYSFNDVMCCCSKHPDVTIPTSWRGFTLLATSRGKEMQLSIRNAHEPTSVDITAHFVITQSKSDATLQRPHHAAVPDGHVW